MLDDKRFKIKHIMIMSICFLFVIICFLVYVLVRAINPTILDKRTSVLKVYTNYSSSEIPFYMSGKIDKVLEKNSNMPNDYCYYEISDVKYYKLKKFDEIDYEIKENNDGSIHIVYDDYKEYFHNERRYMRGFFEFVIERDVISKDKTTINVDRNTKARALVYSDNHSFDVGDEICVTLVDGIYYQKKEDNILPEYYYSTFLNSIDKDKYSLLSF